MALLYKLYFTFIQVNYFSFGCQLGFLVWIYPPPTSIKIGRDYHPFGKYSQILDNGTISNTILLLIPLIIKFLSVTVSSLLPHFACHFQKSITNRLWRSKQSGFIAWILWGTESSIQITGVCGLGYIICYLLYTSRDKKSSSPKLNH